jgi:hypothetical protein
MDGCSKINRHYIHSKSAKFFIKVVTRGLIDSRFFFDPAAVLDPVIGHILTKDLQGKQT